MPNGRPGDSPYLDFVVHGIDFGEPEIAKRLRRIADKADNDVERLTQDLVDCTFRDLGLIPADYRREIMMQHLDVIEELIARRAGKRTKYKKQDP